MNRLEKVRGESVRGGKGPGGVPEAVPVGIPPLLRRFWDFARKMAKQFSKNMNKDHEDDFLKVVRRDFEDWKGN